jgi:hypothetical protein
LCRHLGGLRSKDEDGLAASRANMRIPDDVYDPRRHQQTDDANLMMAEDDEAGAKLKDERSQGLEEYLSNICQPVRMARLWTMISPVSPT